MTDTKIISPISRYFRALQRQRALYTVLAVGSPDRDDVTRRLTEIDIRITSIRDAFWCENCRSRQCRECCYNPFRAAMAEKRGDWVG